MPNPPVTRKPIPHSIKGWRAEVAGIQRCLDKLELYRRDQGTAWVQAQRDYFRRRMDDLLDNAPPSVVRMGQARQARRR